MAPAAFSLSFLPPRYGSPRLLGRGSAGRVFEAEDALLRRKVAIKVLDPPPARAVELAARLAREAALLASLDHPSIVRVFDVSPAPVPYIVMELIEGESLEESVTRDGPLPPEHALALARDLLGALAHAHARGVIHRDVKPGNVLLGRDGRARLVDFGLARLDDGGLASAGASLLGTLDYAAPELVATREASVRTDLYGAAALLWFALAGRPPRAAPRVKGRSPLDPPDPAALASAPALGAVLVGALARDPAARPARAEDLAAALVAAAAPDPLEAAVRLLALARDALHPLKNRLSMVRRHAADPARILALASSEAYRTETLRLLDAALGGLDGLDALASARPALAAARAALAVPGRGLAEALAEAHRACESATRAARELARAHLLDLGTWARGLAARVGGAGLALSVELDPALDPELLAPVAEALARSLDRIAETLLANAAEAGAARVVLALGPGPEDCAGLAFTDDGPGLPAGDLEALFRRGGTSKAGGSGLGLSDARALARRLGGTLGAERKAKGAAFVLRLPRRTLAPEGGAAP